MKRALLAAVTLLLCACPRPCSTNGDCDDGLFCNGHETCSMGVCAAGTAPNCDDGIACTSDVCNEARYMCESHVPDVDGDGHGAATCRDQTGVSLGDDCDDHDALRFPGNHEVCDPTHDEDCDLTTLGGLDADHDGYVSSACGNTDVDGGVTRGLDCNDSNEGVHPGQLETCNHADDNCNGLVDEDVQTTRYPDLDGDGWGTGTGVTKGCASDPNTASRQGDCDDTDPAMHPGQFKCDTATEYALCQLDGGYFISKCTHCVTQPGGLGLCTP